MHHACVSCFPSRTTRENKPSRQGVVRAMARFDPSQAPSRLRPSGRIASRWRWVSTPRWSRTSRNVTSICQRWIGAEQGLRIELAGGVADQHPPYRDDGHPALASFADIPPRDCFAMAPDGGADLDVAPAAAIPAWHRDALPYSQARCDPKRSFGNVTPCKQRPASSHISACPP